MFEIFVVDLLHEVELGVWKALFIHLMRILQAVNPACIHEIDRRYALIWPSNHYFQTHETCSYRDMPTFGRATIRRFATNSSEMKKMAAYNFEDLLQVTCLPLLFLNVLANLFFKCAIPAFESLLPEPHNKIILDLLFLMANWHGLAKLRLHTDHTLTHLDNLTSRLGEQLRIFQRKTCSAFKTTELPRETSARQRQQTRQATKGKRGSANTTGNQTHSEGHAAEHNPPRPVNDPGPTAKARTFKPNSDQKSKVFNLHTYKNHSLGDYVEMIRKYGTVDSYNTELVSFL